MHLENDPFNKPHTAFVLTSSHQWYAKQTTRANTRCASWRTVALACLFGTGDAHGIEAELENCFINNIYN